MTAKAPQCACGTLGELRICHANSGIAWRCPRCLAILSKWLPHPWVLATGIDVNSLPDWNTPAGNDRQAGLPL